MFEYPQAVDQTETPDSTVGRIGQRRFLSQSGVYAKLAQAIESFGKTGWEDDNDDEQEAVTLVRVPVLPVSAVANADVADELESEELTVPLSLRHAVPLAAAAEHFSGSDTATDEKTWVRLPKAAPAVHAGPSAPSAAAQLEEAVFVEAESVVDNEPVCARSSSASPGTDCLQVTLQLRGDELARLWAHQSAALAGRAYVWSRQSQSWELIDHHHDALHVMVQPALTVSQDCGTTPAAVRRSRASAITSQLSLTDLGFVALGAAAALSVILCLSRFIPYASASAPEVETKVNESDPAARVHEVNVSTRAAAVVNNRVTSNAPATRVESRQIIPVTALPLVGKRGLSRSRNHG